MGNILFLPFPSPSNAVFGAGYIFIRLLPKMILFTEPAVFQAKNSCAKSTFEPRLCLLLVLRYSSLKTFYNLVIWSSRWLQTNIGKDYLLSCLSATFCPKIGKNSFCRQKVFFCRDFGNTFILCPQVRRVDEWTVGSQSSPLLVPPPPFQRISVVSCFGNLAEKKESPSW